MSAKRNRRRSCRATAEIAVFCLLTAGFLLQGAFFFRDAAGDKLQYEAVSAGRTDAPTAFSPYGGFEPDRNPGSGTNGPLLLAAPAPAYGTAAVLRLSYLAVFSAGIGALVFLGILLYFLLLRPILKQNRLLAVNEERYQTILEQSRSLIFEYVFSTDTMYTSGWWERTFGYSLPTHDLRAALLSGEIVYEPDIPKFRELMEHIRGQVPYEEFEIRLKKADGSHIWTQLTVSVFYDADGNPLRAVGKVSDIDTQKKQTQHLMKKAESDSLTGLFNNGTTREKIDGFLKGEGKDGMHALFIIDIDDFKQINDTLGHLCGDAVLSEISTRVSALYRKTDIIGRIGGDEFVIFLKDLRSEERVISRAEEVIRVFSTVAAGLKSNLRISGSVGISLYPRDGADFNELFAKADRALYYAKKNGKNRYHLFDANQNYDGFEDETTPLAESVTDIGADSHGKMAGCIFKILYGAESFPVAVGVILELLGTEFSADRVYLYEFTPTGLCNTHEWCREGVSPMSEQMQNLPYSQSTVKSWFENGLLCYTENNGEVPLPPIRCAGRPPSSIVQRVITGDRGVQGFVGMERKAGVAPSQEEIETLTLVSNIFGLFSEKSRTKV